MRTISVPSKTKPGLMENINVKTREDLIPSATPIGISVTDKDMFVAQAIADDIDLKSGNRREKSELIIQYIRDNPIVFLNTKERGFQIGLSCPKACLIAFKFEDRLYVGWSHINKEDLESKISYSKREARICAVLRGLKDVIDLESMTTLRGTPLPHAIRKHIDPFVGRVSKYFRISPCNVK